MIKLYIIVKFLILLYFIIKDVIQIIVENITKNEYYNNSINSNEIAFFKIPGITNESVELNVYFDKIRQINTNTQALILYAREDSAIFCIMSDEFREKYSNLSTKEIVESSFSTFKSEGYRILVDSKSNNTCHIFTDERHCDKYDTAYRISEKDCFQIKSNIEKYLKEEEPYLNKEFVQNKILKTYIQDNLREENNHSIIINLPNQRDDLNINNTHFNACDKMQSFANSSHIQTPCLIGITQKNEIYISINKNWAFANNVSSNDIYEKAIKTLEKKTNSKLSLIYSNEPNSGILEKPHSYCCIRQKTEQPNFLNKFTQKISNKPIPETGPVYLSDKDVSFFIDNINKIIKDIDKDIDKYNSYDFKEERFKILNDTKELKNNSNIIKDKKNIDKTTEIEAFPNSYTYNYRIDTKSKEIPIEASCFEIKNIDDYQKFIDQNSKFNSTTMTGIILDNCSEIQAKEIVDAFKSFNDLSDKPSSTLTIYDKKSNYIYYTMSKDTAEKLEYFGIDLKTSLLNDYKKNTTWELNITQKIENVPFQKNDFVITSKTEENSIFHKKISEHEFIDVTLEIESKIIEMEHKYDKEMIKQNGFVFEPVCTKTH